MVVRIWEFPLNHAIYYVPQEQSSAMPLYIVKIKTNDFQGICILL